MDKITYLFTEEKTILLTKMFFISKPGKLCRLPYPRHKNGCPNYGKSSQCPPRSVRIERKYDLKKPCYFAYIKFDLAGQEKRMLKKNPGWTKKQARCLLYWQNSVRKRLIDTCEMFCYQQEKLYDFELIPEAMGMHVFETAAQHGIPIKRNPEKYVYKIAFMGVVRKEF